MSPFYLLRLLVTMLGIYFVGSSIPSLVFALAMVAAGLQSEDPHQITVWLSLVGPGVSLLFGGGLIVYREHLARWLGFEDSSASVPLSAQSLHVIGLSIVGAFFLVRGAADISAALALGIIYRSLPDFDTSLASASAQFLLGMAVFFGAPGLVGLWSALRSRGGASAVDSPENDAA